jgi:hypothetical protein
MDSIPWQLRTTPLKCRTAELGGHIDACDDCGNITISYNSAATGIVPVSGQREDWIQARETELLPVPYFHVVLPCPIVSIH